MSLTLEQLGAEFERLLATRAADHPPPAADVPVASQPAAGLAGAVSPGSATPATTTTAPAAAPKLSVQVVDHALKGYHLDVTVAPDQVVAAAEIADRAGFGLDAITGVDWLAQNEMEVVYDYFHPTAPLRLVVRTRTPRATPEVPTILGIFPGANWHERETHDFFGIRFAGHPNLKPFLLPEDADFHPLRKDYQP